MTARLASVNVAVLREGPWTGDMGRTGIDKRPTTGRVRAHALGLDGDIIVDTRFHGGLDQALYAFAREDAGWWAKELDRELPVGSFGENLSTDGLAVNAAVIGERWAIGTTVVEVSSPRVPCRVFAGFWGVPDLIKRFTARGLPGAYLRVLTEGDLGAGDEVKVLHRPAHGLTIATTFRALTTQPELLRLLVGVPELPEKIRDTVRRRVRGVAV
jgi:MOSC domain-containing protein YiiM